MEKKTLACRQHQVVGSIAFVILWLSIWGLASAAGDALGEHVRDIINFFGWLITVMLGVGISLIVFIYRSSMKSISTEGDLKLTALSNGLSGEIKNLQTELAGDVDAIGEKVHIIDSRVTKLEGGIEGVYKTLSREYMRVEEHGRICDKQGRVAHE